MQLHSEHRALKIFLLCVREYCAASCSNSCQPPTSNLVFLRTQRVLRHFQISWNCCFDDWPRLKTMLDHTLPTLCRTSTKIQYARPVSRLANELGIVHNNSR
mmetsp:Transcript_7456/g.27940  ORF Transcript_7456/g.27940 Transcript_7456/m.27940 type:complete len:102 (+) Transcript_7456:3248-3553(+)